MAGAKKLMQFHCTRIHIQINLNQIYKSIKRCIKIPGIIEDYHIQCNVIIWIKNRYWWCHASCRFHQDKMDVKRIEMGLTARGTRSRSFDCAFLVNDAKFSRCQQNVKASRRSPPKPLRGIGRCSSVVILRISIERRTHVDAEDPEKKKEIESRVDVSTPRGKNLGSTLFPSRISVRRGTVPMEIGDLESGNLVRPMEISVPRIETEDVDPKSMRHRPCAVCGLRPSAGHRLRRHGALDRFRRTAGMNRR